MGGNYSKMVAALMTLSHDLPGGVAICKTWVYDAATGRTLAQHDGTLESLEAALIKARRDMEKHDH
jgi:hypothetical protein